MIKMEFCIVKIQYVIIDVQLKLQPIVNPFMKKILMILIKMSVNVCLDGRVHSVEIDNMLILGTLIYIFINLKYTYIFIYLFIYSLFY